MSYIMTDSVTGNEFTFDDAIDPVKAKDIIISKRLGAGATPTPPPMIEGAIDTPGADLPTGKDIVKGIMQPYGRAALETIGLVGGGKLGGVPGAAVGYAGAKSVADAIEETAGLKPSPSMLQRAGQGAVDVGVGGLMEMGGQTGAAILKPVVSAAAKGGKALMGRITGAGTGAVEEALKSGAASAQTEVGGTTASTAFDKAMKQEISGEEIVNHARSALQAVRNQRSTAYKTELQAITTGPRASLDISPIRRRLLKVLDGHGLRIGDDGVLEPKFSGSVLNKADMAKAEEITEMVFRWGKKAGDRTPLGVDTLKQYLDNYYSDSSAIRQMVASLRDETKTVLVKGVPGYENMVKGYAEATNALKDFESGLMLRKQGMSGRVTADQTLRRLISAMKDNYELRRDLVKVLGEKGGVDLTGEVAGHAMSQTLPRGLAGESPFLIGEVAMAYKLLNPQWWPILSLSSPRVAGAFLRMIGKTAAKMPGASSTAGQAAGYGLAYGMSNLFNTGDVMLPEDTVPPAQPAGGFK